MSSASISEAAPVDAGEARFPAYPPGLWRRIVLQPGPGWIGGALEDDVHRFHLRLDHDGERIVAVAARAVRHPWTACPGAAPHLERELTGALLADVARRDAGEHCTHLLDLAILCAAHAGDKAPTRFDMHVADRVEDRTTATLSVNGSEVLRWLLAGTTITGFGLDLRKLSHWKHTLPPSEAEMAVLLRRAVFVSGARSFVAPPLQRASEVGEQRLGACYNFQLPRAAESTRRPDWRTDFASSGGEPLADFGAVAEFEQMAGDGK